MKILILSSSSRHFPLDIQDSLKAAGLESHRLRSLNEFISSPLRKEPFLAILEVGTTEDVDRALVAYEWAETVQPLAAARYLLLLGSKHISLQEKANRFRGVEIAQLPLPNKNLLFKIELQLKVLSKESHSKIQRKLDGFTAEIHEVNKERVMVVRGMSPGEGGWKNSGEAPQGRTRWRWIDDPPKKGKPEENFSWSAESKTAPVFNPKIGAWEVKDTEADLQCHRDGQEIFSAKKALGGAEAKSAQIPNESAPAKTAAGNSFAAEISPKSSSSHVAGPDPASNKNNLSGATEKPSAPSRADTAKPAPEPKRNPSAATFSGEKQIGANPLRDNSDSPIPAPASRNLPPQAAGSTSTAAEKEPPGAASPPPEMARPQTPRISSELPAFNPLRPSPANAPAPAKENPVAAAKAQNAAPEKESPEKGSNASARQEFSLRENSLPKEIESASFARGGDSTTRPSESSPARAAHELTQNLPAASAGLEKPEALIPKSSQSAALADRPAAHRAALPIARQASAPPEANPAQEAPNPARVKESAGSQATPDSPKISSPAGELLQTRGPRTEVLHTSQEQPAEGAADTTTEFPEATREITGKILIPTASAQSEPRHLLRASGERETSELNLVTGQAKANEERQHLKARYFLTLSLEELQDQNSTWIPVEGYRIYLSARHRYYGLRELADIFPLWVYEGELPPEFLDLKKAWKFYDRLPKSFFSLESLPAPVAKYLLELNGAQVKEAAGEEAMRRAPAAKPAAGEVRFLARPGGEEGAPHRPSSSADSSSALDRILSAIRGILGLGG